MSVDPLARSTDIMKTVLSTVRETNRTVKLLLEENAELREEIHNIREDNKRVQKRLLHEMIELRKELTDNKGTILKKTKIYMPKTEQETMNISLIMQYTSVTDFMAFEETIKNSLDEAQKLEYKFCNNSATAPPKFIRNNWKSIMTDELASNFSWRGTSTKEAARSLAVTAALRDAFNRRFAIGERHFEMVSAKWFQTANDRIKYKKKTGKREFEEIFQ